MSNFLEQLVNDKTANDTQWREQMQAERDNTSAMQTAGINEITSNPEAYALERAKRRGVPAIPLSRKQLGQEPFEAALMEALTQYRVDLVVLAGFLSILSADFVRRWPDRIVNVHPSLIPAFCGKGYYGLKVHEAALRRGVRVTGATVHLVNEIPDGGRILLQKAVDILPGDTPETLQRRVMEQAEWVLLPQAAEQLAAHIATEKEEHL